MQQPPAPAYIQAMAPYQAGKPIEELAREYGIDPADIIKLASNENPLGCSARVRDVLCEAASVMHGRYPDPNGFDLKSDLAHHHDVPMECITLGNGSNDLLELISLAFLHEGSSAVYSAHAFAVYRLCTQARGARHCCVPAKDLGHDLDAMLAAIEADTRVLFIANPNNPTGTYLDQTVLRGFLDEVLVRYGNQLVVVLDEAYNEYLDPEQRGDSAAWIKQYPNLIVTRSFSKAYGLAGVRVGYGLAQAAVTDLLNRVRQPFNVNAMAQLAARAALQDRDFLSRTYEANRKGRRQLQEGFEALGLSYVPSHTNFVLVRVGEAVHVHAELLRRGVIVRPTAGDGLPEYLRVSIGLPAENERLLQALGEVLHP